MSPPELTSAFDGIAADDVVDALVPSSSRARRVALWDRPLRVFHWTLLAAVAAAIVTGELGGAWMPWHGRAGLCVVGLLVFRLAWGIVGSVTSRFARFAPTPSSLRAYLGGRWRGVGHNPMGALSVFALLGLLAAQAATGLFGNDDIAFAGPLNALVDDAVGSRVTGWHRVMADGLFVLVALHLSAIVFHAVVKRHDLVTPMVTGGAVDEASAASIASADDAAPRWFGGRAALLGAVVLAAGVVLAIAWIGRTPAPPPAPAAKPAAAAPPTW